MDTNANILERLNQYKIPPEHGNWNKNTQGPQIEQKASFKILESFPNIKEYWRRLDDRIILKIVSITAKMKILVQIEMHIIMCHIY